MSLFDGLSTPAWITPQDNDKASWQTSRQFGEIFNAAKDRAMQIALNAPMRAAQVAEADATVKAKQLDIIQKQGLIDAGLQAKQGNAVLAGVVANIAKTEDGWLDDQTEPRLWEVASKYPAVMDTPPWQRTLQLLTAARGADAKAEALQATLDTRAKDAQLAAEAKKYVADTSADARLESGDATRQNRLDVQALKNQGTMDAVQARIRLAPAANKGTLTPEQLASYKARQHAIWADLLTYDTPEKKQAALDDLDKSFKIGLPGTTPAVAPAGTPATMQPQTSVRTGQIIIGPDGMKHRVTSDGSLPPGFSIGQ